MFFKASNLKGIWGRKNAQKKLSAEEMMLAAPAKVNELSAQAIGLEFHVIIGIREINEATMAQAIRE
jgi:hypothetical protein